MAAEYIAQRGNLDIVLCERGIRTFETATRNTLDISAVPVTQRLSHLPVIVDPSHSAAAATWSCRCRGRDCGRRDGIIVDVHPSPETALCDGPQALIESDLRELASVAAHLSPWSDALSPRPAHPRTQPSPSTRLTGAGTARAGRTVAGGAHGTTGGPGRPAVAGRLLFTALGRTLVDGALVRWRVVDVETAFDAVQVVEAGAGLHPARVSNVQPGRRGHGPRRGCCPAGCARTAGGFRPLSTISPSFEQDARLVLTSPAADCDTPPVCQLATGNRRPEAGASSVISARAADSLAT